MSSTTKQIKRTYGDAFGQNTYENEKYNQEITPDYFMKGNIGHIVYQEENFKTTNLNKLAVLENTIVAIKSIKK